MIKTVEETNNCIRLINSMPYNQRISRGELSRATALIAMSVATGVVIGVGFSLYLIQRGATC